MSALVPVKLVAGCLLLFSLTSPAAQAEDFKNVQYAKVGDLPLHLDLYLPAKAEGAPLVVWIHGGGWEGGSKDGCPVTWMTGEGYAVASLQYRLTDKGVFPAQIHDCKGAIRWLRANAKTYGYNAEKIGVVGLSAGGHLVALLGTSGDVKELEGEVGGNLDQSSRVQAVLDMCGPSDLALFGKNLPEEVETPGKPIYKLLGGPLSKHRELADLASPAYHVTKDDAPLLMYHGKKDPIVNHEQAEQLRDVYQQQELEVQLESIEEGGHVPPEFGDAARREMALKFFNRHIKGAE